MISPTRHSYARFLTLTATLAASLFASTPARAEESNLRKETSDTEGPVAGANRPIDIGLTDRAPADATPATFILNRATFSVPEPSK